LHARVLITGTKDDKKIAEELLKLCKSKPIVAVGKSNILQLVSLIRRCRVFVTSDSAPMHIAAASNVGFVVLFGPTDPARHAPPTEKCVIVRKKLSCSPCYNPRCHQGLTCMNKITAEEVFEAVKQLL
jgi:ADP-heptose:LPS heptosyltransferase